MKKTGAQIIVELLERQGIRTVAGIPGGATLPLYDALAESNIRHVLTRHEQGAGFMAQGMARVTGKAAVCFGTSGPGATNLLTAIADARLDSIPMVAITGQVPSSMIGTDAFQEVDTYGLTLPITKHNFLVRSTEELLKVIPLAFEIAESGRPGPVVVDIPKDVQTREIEFEAWPEPGRPAAPIAPDAGTMARMAQMIREAKRPVLYIGGGITASGCCAELRELARKNAIPVACTLMGLGTMATDDPLNLGMLGMHGSRGTNYALEETDLLIAMGVRFDDRATGKLEEFCPQAAIIHVDIDKSEIDKLRPSNLAVAADAALVMRQLLALVEGNERTDWMKRIAHLRALHPEDGRTPEDIRHPLGLIRAVAETLDPDTVVATDVGQHQMWVAQSYPFRAPRTLLTSGGLGTMGFGMPAAIGAALAQPGKRVVCFSGDGSILMNIQELATLADLGLPVTVIILNNGHLGLVRQQQELFYGNRITASKFATTPDFAALARAFGLRGMNLAHADDPQTALADALTGEGPCIVDMPIDYAENVYPMVPPGAANRDMIGGEANA
ncbi:acetolactate synthase large subunit [Salidesulfovibrio onnuriiensis]|uniref:acetolactate synthase large subunit n=1 Tax=Salidesulfovibrio onnuriiensis TaxID=2583823 RepID=UPI0011CCC761|nr:acetolactate synthase large subunit [Salidesulfovibrio onnuriiensis]